MAFPAPSIGDVLMLSQLAWRLGCAFTAGRRGAPAEFQEVENELKSLTTAITLLAEALDEDGSLLARSEEKTKEGLEKILSCCRQTLDNLDAFINQYQEIRRPDEAGGLAPQRSWRQVIMRNWKTIMWTTEGGGVQSLRNMLAMHAQSISLTMHALQSRSLSRLEHIIEPVADQIDNMHNRLNGDLDVKIDEMHHIMLSLWATIDGHQPIVWPTPPPSIQSPQESPYVEPKGFHTQPVPMNQIKSDQFLGRHTNFSTPQGTPELSDSEFSSQSPSSNSRHSGNRFSDHRESALIPLEFQYRIGEPPSDYASSRRTSNRSNLTAFSSQPVSPRIRIESGSDKILGQKKESRKSYAAEIGGLAPIGARRRAQTGLEKSPPTGLVSSSPVTKIPPIPVLDFGAAVPPLLLPPAAIAPDSGAMFPDTDMPHLRLVTYEHSLISSPRLRGPSPAPVTVSTLEQQAAFERRLFTDAAVLCEVRGVTIEYTQPDEENPGEWRMVTACTECKICVVTRRHKSSAGVKFSTSIWALSDDRSVRLQQKLAVAGREIVPYTLWGSEAKVILREPTELKFHDTIPDERPTSTAKTAWVNYVFSDERDATLFQNALMGKTLLLSVKTKRTMRLHDGISGAFAYAEQLCGLENLRVFQDPQTGGVLAMIHYSPHFCDGYMAFYLNSARDAVRVRKDGEKTMRIKGLNIAADGKIKRRGGDANGGGESGRAGKGEKVIWGAKIEFYTAVDRQLFMDRFREIQGSFFPQER